LNLSSLDGSNGFTLNGIADGDYAGGSVASAGDVDGDGIADLILGAFRAAADGSNRGQAYVVFGQNTSFGVELDLSSLDGSNGFTLNGIADNDQAGRSVAGAGDVNGDGIDDVLIGAFLAGANDRGQAYVVFGRAIPVPLIATGPSDQAIPLVRVFNPDGSLRFELHAFDELSAIGGVRLAVGELSGDDQSDLVAASGPGIATRVRVFNGRTGGLVSDFLPYGPDFTRGAFVAVGDVIALNLGNEIIVGPNKGKQPVKIFDAAGTELFMFNAFGPNFKGGVRVAVGVVQAGGQAEIIAAKGVGNGQIRVFDGAGL
jgi:hypothetical protein